MQVFTTTMGKLTITAALEIVFNSCTTRQLPRRYHSVQVHWTLKCSLLNLKKNWTNIFGGASELQPAGLPPTDNILRMALLYKKLISF